MFAKFSWLCVFLAVVLLGWSGFSMIWPSDSRQHGNILIVEDQEPGLGVQTVGNHVIELRLRNTSSQPIQFLGMTSG